MAWIEVHQSLPTHPKTIEASLLLDVSEPVIVGHLVCLWTWAVDAKPDGRLDLSKPRIIARAARWELEPGRFVDALVAVRFLDEDGAIHDWDDYTGRLMERRERVQVQTRARVQAFRERKRLSSIEAPDVTQSVTRYGNARNAPVTLGNAPTGPNRTGPNRTQPPPTTPVDRVAPDAADAAPDAPLVPVSGEHAALWDAFTSIFGEARGKTERQRRGEACKRSREAQATPDEIRTAAAHWPNVMGDATLTELGIVANLGKLLHGPQVSGRSNGTVQEYRQRVTQSATLPPDPRAEIEAHRAARRRATP